METSSKGVLERCPLEVGAGQVTGGLALCHFLNVSVNIADPALLMVQLNNRTLQSELFDSPVTESFWS